MRFGLVKVVVSAVVIGIALELWLSSEHAAVRLQIGRILELNLHQNRIELTVKGHCQQYDVPSSGCNPSALISGTLGLGLEDDVRITVVDVADTHSVESFQAEVLLTRNLSQISSAVLKVSIEHIDDSVECFAVEWLHTVTPGEQHLSADCFSLLSEVGGHWYGGPEVLEQRWPIDRQKSAMQSHVTGDFLSPKWRRQPGFGKYGPVAEPYWITSTGIAILVVGGYDFRSGFNDDGNGRLCLQAVGAKRNASLKYHVCRGENVLKVHQAVSDKFIPRPVGTPDPLIIRKPIWSTWARYKVDVDEAAVDELAREIQQYGFQCSQLEIDDRYSSDYGEFDFDVFKFPNASAMIGRLHDKGYRVTAWVTPFANLHTNAMAEGTAQGYWIADDGFQDNYVPALTRWWQGIGAVIDVSNPEAVAWYVGRLRQFQQQYGIDSFKFDSGEVGFLPPRPRTQSGTCSNDFSTLYANMAAAFGTAIELRSAYANQNLPVFIRMLDKDSVWGYDNGLRSIIPTALLFGLVGYPFVLPDMIGGNGYSTDDVLSSSSSSLASLLSSLTRTILPDRELYIRWLELTAFLPAMQFSVVPWQFDDETVAIGRKFAVELRQSVINEAIEKAANESVETGFPIIRPLWWIDPTDEDSLTCDSEFLIGDRILVAPVLEAGARKRDVYLPGKDVRWKKYQEMEVLNGRQWIRDLIVELDQIAWFERVTT